MSLFDYIKYCGTDLDSEEELDTLPEDLLRLYIAEVHIDIGFTAWLEPYTTYTMAKWDTISGKPKRETFMRALRKYNNDDI